MDSCGNKGEDIVQVIIVKDQSPPQLPETMDDVLITCPNAYKMEDLLAPESLDDCCAKESITVTPTSTEPRGCEDIMM